MAPISILRKGGVSQDEKQDAIDAMDQCLDDVRSTNESISRCFQEYADDENADGEQCLSLKQAQQMLPELAESLDLPSWLFGDLAVQHDFYDFDGDGLLEENECVKLFSTAIKHRRIELGGRREEVKVRKSSLDEAGYRVARELGRGGQGIMYLCRRKWSPFGSKYCVKVCDKSNANAPDYDELVDEYMKMKEFNNPHVARVYDVFQDERCYFTVSEAYLGGDYAKLPKRACDKDVAMTEDWWRGIFKQCLIGLSYLHSLSIVHCDIKEPNIMIAKDDNYRNPQIVLIDFGLCTPFSTLDYNYSGTPGYMPPETYQVGLWGPKGDIFSMGIVFFHTMTGHIPTQNGTMGPVLAPSAAKNSELQCQYARLMPLPWKSFPAEMPELRDLIDGMTRRDHRERMRASEALEHDWFDLDSDADLPDEILQRLIVASANDFDEAAILDQLQAKNNLQELRALQEEFRERDDTTGFVTEEDFIEIMVAAAVRLEDAKAYARCAAAAASVAGDEGCRWTELVKEAISVKEEYARHFLQDILKERHLTNHRLLERATVEELLDFDAFDIPEDDIDDVISSMKVHTGGYVLRADFERILLADGRIGRRSDMEQDGEHEDSARRSWVNGGSYEPCACTLQ